MHSHPKSTPNLKCSCTGSLSHAPWGVLTSMGSTSWAITTSWAFLFSTRVVTVLTPKKQMTEVCFKSDSLPELSCKRHRICCFHSTPFMRTFHIHSVAQRRFSMDNLLKLRVKKLVYFTLHFEFRWRNSYITAIACPILFGWSRAPTFLIQFLSKRPHSHVCK